MSEKKTEILCEWEECRKVIQNPKKGQRFHSLQCRQAWHKNHARAKGITGTAVSVRLLKAGRTSMVIHFDASERNRLAVFNQGQKVKVID